MRKAAKVWLIAAAALVLLGGILFAVVIAEPFSGISQSFPLSNTKLTRMKSPKRSAAYP